MLGQRWQISHIAARKLPKIRILVVFISSFCCSEAKTLCVITCVGMDGEPPVFVMTLHNLKLYLPPVSQKGQTSLLLITKKTAKHSAFKSLTLHHGWPPDRQFFILFLEANYKFVCFLKWSISCCSFYSHLSVYRFLFVVGEIVHWDDWCWKGLQCSQQAVC